jgi:antiphage defense system Thoeris ThsB-like protein
VGLLGSPRYGLFTPPPVRHKIFVSYHHGGDQPYYDVFSRTFHDTYEAIYDNSLERRVQSDDADYVRRRICEDFITGSSCTIVLVGRNTWGRKFVDWEIRATLDKCHGLIAVQLPTAPLFPDGSVRVPDRLLDNIQSGYCVWVDWNRIASHAAGLGDLVALAKGRSGNLIRNDRAGRLANSPLS